MAIRRFDVTTAIATFAFNHGTDAGFRAWGKGTSDLLQAAGAIKTADTGQIDWATVLQPAPNVIAGYEIFKFTDSFGDYYLKLGYGTNSLSSANGEISVQIGLSTDGAMNMPASTSRYLGKADRPCSSSATLLNHYACVKDGILTMQWGTSGLLTIERRRNQTTGNPEPFGDFVVFSRAAQATWGGAAGVVTMTSFRFVPIFIGGPSSHSCLVPLGISSSASGDKYIYRWHGAYPGSRIAIAGCTYLGSEFTTHSTFDAALLGSTVRTYRATGMNAAANGGDTRYTAAVLWE
jgi:hypothetical protein